MNPDWTTDRLLPAPEPPGSLDVYNVCAAPFDVMLSAATMTGLINRQQARIYLLSDGDAEPLRAALLGQIPTGHHPTPAGDVLSELIGAYRSSVRGLIVYDPAMIDSVNIATTLAGLRDAVVVSPQQLESLSRHQLPVLADLRIFGWKNRLQAYRWAAHNLLRETSTRLVAGMGPTIPGGLRSYLVASRAFVYWLNPRRLMPNPANGWMSERCLMKRILRRFAPGTPHLGWFMHELSGVSLASQSALPVLPSDFFYNMEVWSAVTADVAGIEMAGVGMAGTSPATTFHRAPTHAIPPKVYLSFAISDGDNLQYNQHRMYHLWQDPARGSVPIGWTISPVLQESAPMLADYYIRTATQYDELIAGPSGAGYILPSRWPGEQLPAFLRLTGSLMQRMHLAIIEVLDRPGISLLSRRTWQAAYAQALAPFGLIGILTGDAYKRSGWRIVDGVPIIQNLGLTKSVSMALDLIKRNTPLQITQPHYISIYMHAWTTTPSDIKTIAQSLDSRYEVVTPGALLAMIARASR
jgi:hypothetical protein